MWPPKRPVRPKGPAPKDRGARDVVPDDLPPTFGPAQDRARQAVLARTRALRDEAEALLPRLLSFLAADPERLTRFFDLTGLAPDSLRSAVAAPGFAVSLLDYFCADDRLVAGFAAAEQIDPARLDALHRGLTQTDVE